MYSLFFRQSQKLSKVFFFFWWLEAYAPMQDFVLEAARSETGASFGRNAYGNLYQRGKPTPLTVRGKTVAVCEGLSSVLVDGRSTLVSIDTSLYSSLLFSFVSSLSSSHLGSKKSFSSVVLDAC